MRSEPHFAGRPGTVVAQTAESTCVSPGLQRWPQGSGVLGLLIPKTAVFLSQGATNTPLHLVCFIAKVKLMMILEKEMHDQKW